MLAEQVFNDGSIVEEAVDVGANAVVGLQDGLVGIADPLVNLVALALLTIELECHLLGGLLLRHRGVDRQQTQARQTGDGALDAFGVVDRLSQHLIATTDSDDLLAIAVSTQNGLCTTVAAQFQQVVECRLGARQNDDVGLLQVAGVVGIEEVDAWVTLQRVEVGEIADMPQQDNGNVHLAQDSPSPLRRYRYLYNKV